MVQANSISIALTNAFNIPSWVIGIVLAAVVAVVVIGGQRRITALAELLVPFMAIVYILGSLIIIICLPISCRMFSVPSLLMLSL